ncbi:MAG: alpha/beta fold hydrolase [Bacteroidales bacterium]
MQEKIYKIFIRMPVAAAFLIVFLISGPMSHSQNHLNPYKHIEPLRTFQDLEYPYDVKYAELSDDITLAYVDEGSGDHTIIFIHGLGSYLKAWTKNIEVLKQHYRCIAIDLPGYGKSSKKPHSGMMTFYADVVKVFIDKLNLQNVVLAGHSMGGQISLMTANNYPETVQRLILVDPAGFEEFNEGQKQWFRDVMTVDAVMKTTIEQIQTNLAYNFYNMPEDARFMITDRIAMRTADEFENYAYAVVQSVHGMVDEPVFEILDQIRHPVLILFGENDNLIPNRYLNPGTTVDIARKGYSKLPDSKLKIVPQTGHFMQFESPEVFNQSVIDFLGK